MSEHLTHPEKHGGERHHKSPETHHQVERHEHHKHVEKAEHHKPMHELEKNVQEQAVSKEQVAVGELQRESSAPTLGTQRELKVKAYQQTLHKVRTHLKGPDRTFSKFVHQPTIEAASEIGAKTVARPSGILGGGIVALAGSGLVLYMSKHYGFRYNFFVFFLLLAGGFALGMFAELLIRLAIPKRN